jgi:hypothetical protein
VKVRQGFLFIAHEAIFAAKQIVQAVCTTKDATGMGIDGNT